MAPTTTRWIAESAGNPTAGGAQTLLERVIAARGAPADERSRAILAAPVASLLHPPRTLPGATEVAQRLESALRAGHHVAIYGDYDADGITATAIMARAIRAADPAAKLTTYVPDRVDEGYGLNDSALESLAAQGVHTVVTVDCGATACGPARRARELGLQLLITDHHHADPGMIAEADAIAHPSLPGREQAPFRELCGAAVAFKVASEFARAWCGGEHVAKVFTTALSHAMPLVAMGTVADVVPLVDENRIFVARGLALMHAAALPGVRALLDDAQLGTGTRVDAAHVGFRLGPRLNAVGRLGHAREAVELLLTDDPVLAARIVRSLVKHNDKRRLIEREIFDQACERADADPLTAQCGAIVMADDRWHEGVVGIVAQKIAERYGKPAILLALRTDGTAKGSGRSVEGLDILAVVKRAAGDLMLRGGGHAFALGVTVRAEDVPAFAQRVGAACIAERAGAPAGATRRYDAEARPEEMTMEAVRALQVLAPFGRGNPHPAFLLRGARPVAPANLFGADRRHLEFFLAPRIRAIWWSGAAHADRIKMDRPVDLLVQPKIDAFRGVDRLQLEVIDARVT